MHLTGCPKRQSVFAPCYCDSLLRQERTELQNELNRLRRRVEELNKLFADAANERDSALAELKKLKGEK